MSNVSRDNDVPSGDSKEQPQPLLPLIAPEMLPCPDCHGEMVEGWVPDLGHAGIASVAAWQPGPPGVKLGLFHSERIQQPNPKDRIPIRAFRCVRCGFLKLYARAIG